MIPTQGTPFSRVEGEYIDLSVMKILGLILFALVALSVGVWIIWAWWAGDVWGSLSFTPGGAFLGAFFAVTGLLGTPTFIFMLFNGPRLILGKDCLQEATVRGRVLFQIPYRNIARMELFHTKDKKFIGIDLHDPKDPETLLNYAAWGKKVTGWHYTIVTAAWQVPLEQIHDRLQTRLEGHYSERR
jgi:hypothetical protein